MSLLDHLEHLRARPEHVRRRFAFLTASGVTGVVALMWLVSFVSSDTLALDAGGVPSNITTASVTAKQDVSQLLGAASAFRQTLEEGPQITVVETSASSTLETSPTPSDATVIPF